MPSLRSRQSSTSLRDTVKQGTQSEGMLRQMSAHQHDNRPVAYATPLNSGYGFALASSFHGVSLFQMAFDAGDNLDSPGRPSTPLNSGNAFTLHQHDNRPVAYATPLNSGYGFALASSFHGVSLFQMAFDAGDNLDSPGRPSTPLNSGNAFTLVNSSHGGLLFQERALGNSSTLVARSHFDPEDRGKHTLPLNSGNQLASKMPSLRSRQSSTSLRDTVKQGTQSEGMLRQMSAHQHDNRPVAYATPLNSGYGFALASSFHGVSLFQMAFDAGDNLDSPGRPSTPLNSGNAFTLVNSSHGGLLFQERALGNFSILTVMLSPIIHLR
ncbi:hypothetical protein HDU93_001237 [Gonapodya sp. JEL0774]|nr:hypothetical protein HDU93_001237 [Gonapodya sp. JEL0774]